MSDDVTHLLQNTGDPVVRSAMDREKVLQSQPNDCSDLKLVPDGKSRACYVCKNGSIYVEVKSTQFRQATDFLIAIAEPQSRPEFVHHYKLTAYSLYAGSSVGLDTESILERLRRISKNELPASVIDFVRFFTSSYGKVKIVLRRNRVFIESTESEVLFDLLRDETIRTARIGSSSFTKGRERTGVQAVKRQMLDDDDHFENYLQGHEQYENEDDGKEDVVSFEIEPRRLGDVKRAATFLNYPMLEEYDFRKDDLNPDLEMELLGKVKTRPYQDKALAKMFGNNRARSGVIVLPCGAGKTLTGISAACTIRKSTLVLCSNTVACTQWVRQFRFFTNIAENRIFEFSSKVEPGFPDDGSAIVLATTYSMMGISDDRRSEASKRSIEKVRSREWGLLILDEVHMAPAEGFRRTLFEVKTHCKLGLTATLVREDGQIGDLNFLIGPKLYEADWMDLTNSGYLARVLCAEVWCPMSSVFMRAYLEETAESRRRLLAAMNPNKFDVCKLLMERHEADGDKILIFSDLIAAVQDYAKSLHRYYMYGGTSEEEREELLERFRLPNGSKDKKGQPAIQTLIISKIGDVAIDLPEANVLIQVSSHGASRRQEAQRLGRILRPKSKAAVGRFHSYFYSLLTTDTREMEYSAGRRQYLIDQGYTYKIVLWDMLFPNHPLRKHEFVPTSKQQDRLALCTVEKAEMTETNNTEA